MSKEINIQVETIGVKCEVRPLRHSQIDEVSLFDSELSSANVSSISNGGVPNKWKVCENNKEWYGRLPRKKKKQLKKRMGEESFVSWWNGLDVYYHPDVEEELTKLLMNEPQRR